jgi:hypothetical protein
VGVDAQGNKHVLGLAPGSSENAKLKFLPPKAEFLLSNSRKRGSAFCLRFDLINQFDGAFLPYC